MDDATLTNILGDLPKYTEDCRQLKELLLANAIMAGEIPAPTFREEERVRFMLDRFTEVGLDKVSTDEIGNATAVLPGSKGEGTILVSAHVDTPFEASVDHTVTVETDRVCGPSVLDNALGVAAVVTLPTLLERLGIELEHNLLLMGSVRSMGKGNMDWMRFFLENNVLPIQAGVLVEGGSLGRLSYRSLGLLRGNVKCVIPKNYDFGQFGASGAIPLVARIVQSLRAIPLPREPRTEMIFGSLTAGNAYNSIARDALLKFELRSEQIGMITSLREQVIETLEEIRHSHSAEITLEEVSKRRPGGLEYAHPLVRAARRILKELDVEPSVAPSSGELAALCEKGVPGLTLGLTVGEHRHEVNECVEIEPVYKGLAQLVAMLKFMDGGIVDAGN